MTHALDARVMLAASSNSAAATGGSGGSGPSMIVGAQAGYAGASSRAFSSPNRRSAALASTPASYAERS